MLCDKYSDGEDAVTIPPSMSLTRGGKAGNKSSPAFSIATEISRDSGFSTDNNSVILDAKSHFVAPPVVKCPALPIAKSLNSMSSGYQSNETTPTNHYSEVTLDVM